MALKEKAKSSDQAEDNKTADKDEENEKSTGKKSSKMVLILGTIFVVVFLFLVAVMGIGVWMILHPPHVEDKIVNESNNNEQDEKQAAEKKAEEAKKEENRKNKPAQYAALEPSFLVQLVGQKENEPVVMQIDVTVMAREPSVLELVKAHSPRIRNDLIKLFTQQNPRVLRTLEGKEKLQEDAKELINTILTEQGGKSGIEEVLFTNFLIQ